jgi:hypothetical protein
MTEAQTPQTPTHGINHPAPDRGLHQPPPDQALAEHPVEYSDPELAAYTDGVAQDILEDVVAHMPIVLPLMGALQIFMLALIAVWLA